MSVKKMVLLLLPLMLFGIGIASTEGSDPSYDVRILRDTWGVPHIYGKTDADVGFGLAYAHAEDNFITIQKSLMTSRGVMGQYSGKSGAMTDYIVGLLNVHGFVEEKYESDLSHELRVVLEAYAAGINHYGNKYPGELLLDNLLPVTGKDIVAGFVFRAPFFVGLDSAVKELFGDERKREVSQKTASSDSFLPSEAIHVAHQYLSNSEPMGSNGWAVSPKRSADGSTMLLVNPHLAWEGPTTWYEVHLHSEEGWNMTGGLFPGTPMVTLGHNENIAWTHTVNQPDLVDIYVLEINPENENQYRYDDKWLDLEVNEMTIRVKVTEEMSMPVRRTLYTSVHGPVLKTEHGVYAIRYAGWGDIRSAEQWYRMNKANNLAEFQQAMNIRGIHSFNTIYGDKEGNIWCLYNALLPIRTEGYDYSQYLPGNISETMWNEFIPLNELPQVLNPDSGYVQNNNSDPFLMTLGDENPKRDNYSSTHGIETRVTNRTLRARELFSADTSVTWNEFQAYKFDLYYSKDSLAAHAQQVIVDAPLPENVLLQDAVKLIKKWDLSTFPKNTSAALAITTINESISKKPEPWAKEDIAELLNQLELVATRFMEKYGRLDIPWDTFNRIQKGSVDVGIGGGPDILHTVSPRYIEDGTRSVGRSGDGYTALIQWDKNGKLRSRSLHQYGSATIDEKDPHYADQIELMRTRTTKPVWFTEKEIRANLEREYTPYD
jgi:acyl-homoserine-lactone acylase